ncbi:GRAS protein [Artemisia annua]|uniref:GRAS protein n=1 Tax=Artemisia annua TaxID=35608 RepID=A0A2U1LYB5_ARTAN|nr:GRAS protein [Artemisia annua]
MLAPDDELVSQDTANGYSLSQDTASSSPLSSAITSTKVEGFLTALRGLSPKVMVVVEQDSDQVRHNNFLFVRTKAAFIRVVISTMPKELVLVFIIAYYMWIANCNQQRPGSHPDDGDLRIYVLKTDLRLNIKEDCHVVLRVQGRWSLPYCGRRIFK